MLPAMHLGLTEILAVFLVVILIFGARKIPELGDALGKGIRNFKKATKEDDAIDVTPRKSPADQIGAAAQPAGDAAADSQAKKA